VEFRRNPRLTHEAWRYWRIGLDGCDRSVKSVIREPGTGGAAPMTREPYPDDKGDLPGGRDRDAIHPPMLPLPLPPVGSGQLPHAYNFDPRVRVKMCPCEKAERPDSTRFGPKRTSNV
jgi:hypothetical protein